MASVCCEASAIHELLVILAEPLGILVKKECISSKSISIE